MALKQDKRWTIIANPVSAGGAARRLWKSAEQALGAAGINYELFWTSGRGEATRLAQKAIEGGARRILAVGGDGTNHEVVNGIIKQQHRPSSEILYGLWPFGTGNDWIKTYGLPRETDQIIAMIQEEKSQTQDIGCVRYQSEGQMQQRFFVNILGMAYDGYVVYEVERSLAKGKKMSRSIYLQATFRSLRKYRTPKTRVQVNARELDGRHILINAGICKYSGGGMQFVPHADPQDGRLAVTVAGNLGALGVILATPKFYNGKIGQHPKVALYQTDTLAVQLLEDRPLHVEADGEFLGFGPVEVGVLPGALRFLVP